MTSKRASTKKAYPSPSADNNRKTIISTKPLTRSGAKQQDLAFNEGKPKPKSILQKPPPTEKTVLRAPDLDDPDLDHQTYYATISNQNISADVMIPKTQPTTPRKSISFCKNNFSSPNRFEALSDVDKDDALEDDSSDSQTSDSDKPEHISSPLSPEESKPTDDGAEAIVQNSGHKINDTDNQYDNQKINNTVNINDTNDNIHNNNNDNALNTNNINSNAPAYNKFGEDPSSHNNKNNEKTNTKKHRGGNISKKPRRQDATPTNLFSNTTASFVPTPLTGLTIQAVTCAPITSSFISSSLLISRIPKYYMLPNIIKDLGMIADLMDISIDTAEFSDRFNNDLGIFSTEGGRISIIVRTTHEYSFHSAGQLGTSSLPMFLFSQKSPRPGIKKHTSKRLAIQALPISSSFPITMLHEVACFRGFTDNCHVLSVLFPLLWSKIVLATDTHNLLPIISSFKVDRMGPQNKELFADELFIRVFTHDASLLTSLRHLLNCSSSPSLCVLDGWQGQIAHCKAAYDHSPTDVPALRYQPRVLFVSNPSGVLADDINHICRYLRSTSSAITAAGYMRGNIDSPNLRDTSDFLILLPANVEGHFSFNTTKWERDYPDSPPPEHIVMPFYQNMSNLYAINPPTPIPPRLPVSRGGVFTGKIEIVPTPSSRKSQRDSYDSSMAHTSLTPILRQIAIPSPLQSSSTSTSSISGNHQPQTLLRGLGSFLSPIDGSVPSYAPLYRT